MQGHHYQNLSIFQNQYWDEGAPLDWENRQDSGAVQNTDWKNDQLEYVGMPSRYGPSTHGLNTCSQRRSLYRDDINNRRAHQGHQNQGFSNQTTSRKQFQDFHGYQNIDFGEGETLDFDGLDFVNLGVSVPTRKMTTQTNNDSGNYGKNARGIDSYVFGGFDHKDQFLSHQQHSIQDQSSHRHPTTPTLTLPVLKNRGICYASDTSLGILKVRKPQGTLDIKNNNSMVNSKSHGNIGSKVGRDQDKRSFYPNLYKHRKPYLKYPRPKPAAVSNYAFMGQDEEFNENNSDLKGDFMESHYLQTIENYHPNRKSHFQSIITQPKQPGMKSNYSQQKEVFDFTSSDALTPFLSNCGLSRNTPNINTTNSLGYSKIKTISTAAESYQFLPKQNGVSRNLGAGSSQRWSRDEIIGTCDRNQGLWHDRPRNSSKINTVEAFPADILLQSEINLAVPSQHNSKSSGNLYDNDDGFEQEMLLGTGPMDLWKSTDQKEMSQPIQKQQDCKPLLQKQSLFQRKKDEIFSQNEVQAIIQTSNISILPALSPNKAQNIKQNQENKKKESDNTTFEKVEKEVAKSPIQEESKKISQDVSEQVDEVQTVDEQLGQLRQLIKRLKSTNESYQLEKNQIISKQKEEIIQLKERLDSKKEKVSSTKSNKKYPDNQDIVQKKVQVQPFKLDTKMKLSPIQSVNKSNEANYDTSIEFLSQKYDKNIKENNEEKINSMQATVFSIEVTIDEQSQEIGLKNGRQIDKNTQDQNKMAPNQLQINQKEVSNNSQNDSKKIPDSKIDIKKEEINQENEAMEQVELPETQCKKEQQPVENTEKIDSPASRKNYWNTIEEMHSLRKQFGHLYDNDDYDGDQEQEEDNPFDVSPNDGEHIGQLNKLDKKSKFSEILVLKKSEIVKDEPISENVLLGRDQEKLVEEQRASLEMRKRNTIRQSALLSLQQFRVEDFRSETSESEIDEEQAIIIKQNFDNYQRRIQMYQNYLLNPPKDKRPFVELRLSIDQQLIEEQLTIKQINNIFFKMCKYYYREDGTLTPDQLMSYLTVDGLMPNSDDVMNEIEKLGVLDEEGLINLNGFKHIIQHFKNIVIEQLQFRERIEDILKINILDKPKHEFRYLLQDFYSEMIEYIYGKGSHRKKGTHLLVTDLIKIVSLGFQNPEFFEISNLIYSFDESREGVLDFNEFLGMVHGLHNQQKERIQEFQSFVREIVSDMNLKNTTNYIKEAFELGQKINLLNGKQLKVYDMIDALTNDQKNENTFDMIDILQQFDGDYSGIFDINEFTKFVHQIRYKKLLQIQICSKSLKLLLQKQDKQIKEEQIKIVFEQFTLINLLEDYRFSYEELKEVLWEQPEEITFKLFYKQIKHKPRDEIIHFNVFKKYVYNVQLLSKEVSQINNILGNVIQANIQENQKEFDPQKLWNMILTEKNFDKQLEYYDQIQAEHQLQKTKKELIRLNQVTDKQKDEIASKILGVFGHNNHIRMNRKKIIANSQQSRNLFTRKQSVNRNDIDRTIQNATQLLNNNNLKDQLQHVKGIRIQSINLESNIQYNRVIKRYEDRLKLLNRMKHNMNLIDKDRFEVSTQPNMQAL